MPAFAEVALHLPLDQLFTYAVPEPLRAVMAPGVRVQVPFQTRVTGGTCVRVLETLEEPPAFTVKPLLGVLDPEPLFTPAMMRLARWIARRYGASLGETLDAALPFAVRSGGKRRRVLFARVASDRAAAERVMDELEPKHEKQARALRYLLDASEPMELRDLCRRAKITESPVKTLARHGHVLLERREAAPEFTLDGPLPVEAEAAKDLTPAQRTALDALLDAVRRSRHHEFLLLGVTGSGKTEVYLRALDAVVRGGRQGIVLVPEIALTPQTVARFKARFPRVAVLHSHLTDAERHQQWRAIQKGGADVVIGARSAVFAPLPRLGIVIVDEEHEGTFKQQNAPRYHARDVARARSRLEKAVLLLGSATPALESYRRARSGLATLLRLPERVAGGSFPDSIVADLNQYVPTPGKARFLSDRLRAAIAERVARREQVILFLNRRGYATGAWCQACGTALKCRNCDIALVFHRRIGRSLCHYCGHEERLPAQCAACGGPFRLSGFGTERIEDEIRRALPEASIARMDSDTMKTRGAYEDVLSRFKAGSVDVLVGTQMIAKGLDFPNVTLVGVVSADTTLQIPDYRAAERTFDLIAQVSGRAGRGEKVGLVIVQTRNPEHFALRLALRHDYEAFAAIELEARRRDGYPPFGHLARAVFQGPDEAEVIEAARRTRDHVSEWVTDDTTSILGPAAAPIARINEKHRHHVIVKARHRSGVQRFVKVLRRMTKLPAKVRVLLDVDPQAML